MSIIPDCFLNLVGVSQNECECFDTADKPEPLEEPLSGLYLDELDKFPVITPEELNDCSEGGFWVLGARSIEAGIRDLISHVSAYVRTNTRRKINPCYGVIGDTNYEVKQQTQLLNYSGVRLFFPGLRGVKFTMKEIGVAFDTTIGSIGLTLADNITGDLGTIPVASQAHKINWNELDPYIQMEFFSPYVRARNLFLYYENTGAFKPMTTKFFCGCNSSKQWCFNVANPLGCLSKNRYSEDCWAENIMAAGIEGDVEAEREDWSCHKYTNGIYIKGDITCDDTVLFCNDDVMDFANGEIGLAVAHAIRFRAGSYFVNRLMVQRGKVNQLTALDNKTLKPLRDSFDRDFKDRVEWIGEQMARGDYLEAVTDCLACNDTYVKKNYIKF